MTVNLSSVHARGHAAPYRSFEEFWGRRRPEQGIRIRARTSVVPTEAERSEAQWRDLFMVLPPG
jgi:hypothetical protein